MASDSYPRPGFNSGQVTELLYERLAAPQAPDGLIGYPTDQALVYADGLGTRTVRIRANRRALVRGFQYDSGTTDIDLSLPANTSGTTRTDLIVLRLTRATWRVQETYIQGTAGQGAPSPLNTDAVFDLPVAQVTVAHNAAALAGNTVTDLAWYVGADGQILCTTKTRPPHERGRRIYETDTSRGWLSTGTSWLIAGDDSGVTTLPLAGGWSSSVNVLHRVNGQVFLALSPQRTGASIAANTTVTLGTLPAGFRPRVVFEGLILATNVSGRYTLNPNGVVQVYLYSGLLQNRYCNFNPVTFPAAL